MGEGSRLGGGRGWSGYRDGTGGSRVTVATGLAVYEAAHDALRQLKERAAKLLEKTPEEIEFNRGIFGVKNGATTLTLKELAGRLARAGGPVVGRATLDRTRQTGT